MCSTAIEFAWLKIVLMVDLLELTSIMGRSVYATNDGSNSLERDLLLYLWHMFELAGLTEVMR